MRRPLSLVAVLLVALAFVPTVATAASEKIPAHPSKLSFGELDFEVPDAEPYRHELSNGVVVYVAEDPSLPLVNVSIQLKIGSFLDPEEKPGLASMTGVMLRRGGAGDMPPREFDERVDFLAAQMSSFTGDTGGGASLNCITPVLDEAMTLFFTMLREPRFDEERFGIEKTNALENLKQRNDDASDILSREWTWLMRGRDHFTGEYWTKSTVEAIGRDDLVGFHEKYWTPENMIIAVSGDVETDEILERLERELEAFGDEGAEASWPPPAPKHEPDPGVYYVEKDIPQARVFIGHLSSQWDRWDDPDAYALRVMSHILGDSGFTSRMTKRIRSDEGLAYSAGARYAIGNYWPGTFRVSFQTKSSTVALAKKIALEEIRKIQSEPVTDVELATAKGALVDSFPGRFNSPASIIGTFVSDEWLDRPHSYWSAWRDRIESVTPEDIQRVAKEYLHPEKMVTLIVGRWEEVVEGDPDGRASMTALGADDAVRLPLRDPLTLEPLSE